ncbi:MAG: hypothetical protein ACE5GK_11105 [Nitrospiria bacterium]
MHFVQWTAPEVSESAYEIPQGSLLKALEDIENGLFPLLNNPKRWESIDIDYHPPRVERVFMQQAELRVSLHCIHPCPAKGALFHPHPWPSAMRILSGRYEMAVGFGPGKETPPISLTLVSKAGSAYEMIHPNAWHSVRPIGKPVMTLMISGKPWKRIAPRSAKSLPHLSGDRKGEILTAFKEFYKR